MVVGAVGPDAPEPAVIPFVMVKDPAAGNVEIRGAVGGDTLPDPSVRRTAHDGIVGKIQIANAVFRPVFVFHRNSPLNLSFSGIL